MPGRETPPSAGGPDGSHPREPDRIVVDAENAGRRLDGLVRQLLPETPLGTVMKWVRKGTVRVDGRKAAPDARLELGQVVSVPAGLLRGRAGAAGAAAIPAPRPDAAARRALAGPDGRLPVTVLFEDEVLLVVDKPAGLAVHAGSGHERDSLLERVVAYLGPAAREPGHRPGLAQRLDVDVSGVLAIGKTARALRALSRAVAEDAIDKRYVALAAGDVERDGTIELPLEVAHDAPRGQRTRPGAAGVPARTAYRVLERLGRATLLELRIHTGRQHQIRAHLLAIEHPIVGDPRYGPAPGRDLGLGLARPFLHAASLALAHPADGRALRLEAPLPSELARVLDRLRASARGPVSREQDDDRDHHGGHEHGAHPDHDPLDR